jgi:biotin synthase-like enzyme
VRINSLVQDQGTPLAGIVPLDPLAFISRIAIARITMPRAAGAPGHALLNRVGPRV